MGKVNNRRIMCVIVVSFLAATLVSFCKDSPDNSDSDERGKYGLKDKPKRVVSVTKEMVLEGNSLDNFTILKSTSLYPFFYQYEWKLKKDDLKGNIHLAVCGNRATAEYIWVSHLSGFMKLDPSRIRSGKKAKFGDIEYNIGSRIIFLRNNVFCEIFATEGKSHKDLVTAINSLADKLKEKISKAEKPTSTIKRNILIDGFSAGSNVAKKGERVTLKLKLRKPDNKSKIQIKYYSESGKVLMDKSNNAVFIPEKTGDCEIRVFALCPYNVVLSKVLSIAVTE